MVKHFKLNKIILLISLFFVSIELNAAFAQTKQEDNLSFSRKEFIETFKNKTIDQVLNGAFIDWGSRKKDTSWSMNVNKQGLQIQHYKDDRKIKNYPIRFIQFPEDTFPITTDQLDIEAEVSLSTQNAFGAGVFIGFEEGNSLNFLIDSKKGFLIAYKNHNENIVVIHRGESNFIHSGKKNKISIEVNQFNKNINFKVNNNILSTLNLHKINSNLNLKGKKNQIFVGIATFGKGNFTFHQVTLKERTDIEIYNTKPKQESLRTTTPEPEKEEPVCKLPSPKEDAQITVFSISRGKALSSIALDSVVMRFRIY